MPKGPRGQKRPADVVGTAVKVARIATGEFEDKPDDDGTDKAAVELGRMGGRARARSHTERQRSEIAKRPLRLAGKKAALNRKPQNRTSFFSSHTICDTLH